MSEALDFINDFQKLLSENDKEQARVLALRSEKEELEKQINSLTEQKTSIVSNLETERQKSLGVIAAAQNNAARIFKAEDERISNRELELKTLEAKLLDLEPKLNQRKAELDQKEIELIGFAKKIKHLEIDVREKAELVARQKDENDCILSRVKAEKDQLEAGNKGLKQGQTDLTEQLHAFKNSCIELHTSQDTLKKGTEALKQAQKQLEQDRLSLEKRIIEIEKQEKEIRKQDVMIADRMKDLQDKEKSIAAMKMELDFKIARLEKAKNE